jgi:hypothetical protein
VVDGSGIVQSSITTAARF